MDRPFDIGTIAAAPWKNGGGATREIARSSVGSPFWRISVADVDREGPFSTFPGLERILTVIEGDAMTLARARGDLLATRHVPVRFAGSDGVTGRLPAGAVRNFNVIFDATLLGAEVTVTDSGRIPAHFGAIGVVTVVYCIRGAFRRDNGATIGKGSGIVDPSGTLHGNGRALIVRITARRPEAARVAASLS